MNITVIGAGALGRLWLYYLAKAGHDVHAMTREKSISELQYHITDLSEQTSAFTCLANDEHTLGIADVILITLKAHTITSVLTACVARLPKNIPILILHNGMGVSEELELNLPQAIERFYYGVTTQAAYVKNNHVVHAANGRTVIGQRLKKQCLEISSLHANMLGKIIPALNEALAPVTYSENINTVQWHKLAINALINPLTVKYQCKNGQLIQYQDELLGLHQELVCLLTELSLNNECYGEVLEGLMENVLNVISQTRNNYSSMYQDYLSQRPSEIEYITGYVLAKAREIGIKMPLHQALYESVMSQMKIDGAYK